MTLSIEQKNIRCMIRKNKLIALYNLYAVLPNNYKNKKVPYYINQRADYYIVLI